MAAAVIGIACLRRFLQRNRIFHDRTNPLDVYDCVNLHKKYLFRRHDILQGVHEVGDEIEHSNRGPTLPASPHCIVGTKPILLFQKLLPNALKSRHMCEIEAPNDHDASPWYFLNCYY